MKKCKYNIISSSDILNLTASINAAAGCVRHGCGASLAVALEAPMQLSDMRRRQLELVLTELKRPNLPLDFPTVQSALIALVQTLLEASAERTD